jgi:hypothetical protein
MNNPARLPRITHVRDLDGELQLRQRYASRAATGRELRLSRGAYLDASTWADLTPREKHLARIAAVIGSRRSSDLVLSHWSAAALHGLPILGVWPEQVHAIGGKSSGGRSDARLTNHAFAVNEADVVDLLGFRVTSIARTVVDMAVADSYLGAVVIADRALLTGRPIDPPPRATQEELLETWERALPFRGFRRAFHIINFAESRSESPLESVSRANMRLIGAPAPELQREFRDHAGLIGRCDFYWESLRMVGEADGEAKYLDPEIRGGKTAEQVVLEEKSREDRIRAVGEGVTRWRWATGVNPALLRTHLNRAGIPTTR